ncbi:UNVERIFIED_CONTAM: phospho-acceptor domain-containing protein [Acetivibrio alkalicellulosi]
MSIRFKLLLSNIFMIVIPLVSSLILAIIIIGVNLDRADFKNHKFEDRFSEVAHDVFKEFITISNDALYNPDRFYDMDYLKNMDTKLKTLNSSMAFTINDEIYYLSDKINKQEFKDHLSRVSKKQNENEKYIFCEMSYFNHSFNLSTGEDCSLYIFFSTKPIEKFAEGFVKDFLKGFFIIIILTNGILTFFVSRSIIRPLRKLKYGAEQIKEGDLSFVIDEKSNDEVGEVCHAFEEMRKRLKGALEDQLRYDEERNEFIASITHDLKTPLTSIKGHLDGLRDGIADTPEKAEKYRDIIYKKVIDMDRLINDLTFYSNQTLKKVPFNFSKVDLKIFIEDIIDEYQMELEKLGVEILNNYNLGSKVLVKADVEKLKRVVSNILENSIKYMDKENGQIKIDVQDVENKVLIGIHDNGEGIKKDYLPNIFNRFYRVDASRNTSKGGSGLGLAIAHQIIEAHGGNIWAESEFGKGTSIYFELEKVDIK